MADAIEMKIRPTQLHRADPEALLVNGYDADEWAKHGIQKEAAWHVVKDFIARYDLPIIAGHNVHFDLGFIREAWDEWGIKPPRLDFRHIDTYGFALLPLLEGKSRSISLSAARAALGIETGTAHRALADAMASMRLAEIGLRRMRGSWWARLWRRVSGRG